MAIWYQPHCGLPAISARPPGPAQILPETAIRVSLRMQGLRTRVFRGVELKDHPLWIRNARVRGSVQEPDVVVRKLKVHGTNVVFQLLDFAGSDDHAADRRPSEHPRERHTGRTCAMPTRHLLQCIDDAVAHLL